MVFNVNAILPELILAGGILLIFFLDLIKERINMAFLSLIGAVTCIISALSTFHVKYPTTIFFGGFKVGSAELVAKMLIYLITALVLFSLYDFYNRRNSHYGEVVYLILTAALGLSFMLSSTNLAVIFVGLELSSISLYILIALLRKEYVSKEGSYKYLVMGAIGTSMFAIGIAFVYLALRTMNITAPLGFNPIITVGIAFIIFALALKMSSVPFHFWTPDACEGAPTPITAFLATVPKIGYYFLMAKLTIFLFPSFEEWYILVGTLAVLSMFYGNITAYAQRSVKRLFAYSSIAHAGYFLVAFTTQDKFLMSSALFYVFVYSLATLGVFTVLTALEKQEGWRNTFEEFKGLFYKKPLLAVNLALFLFALIGIPPMALFVGKLGIFIGLISKDMWLLGFLFAIGSLISAGYYLKLIVYMFLKESEGHVEARLSVGEMLTIYTCAFLVLLFGLYPKPLFDIILRSI